MKLRLSAREQRVLLIVAGLAIGILWMYAALIVGPLTREAAQAGGQVRAAREQLRVLELATVNETALREQHRQLQETVASLRKLLPAEGELPQVIELLSDLAGRSQVKIQTIFPQRTPEASRILVPLEHTKAVAEVSKEVFIQVDAVAGYHQLGAFLSLVETGDKPMQVSSLQLVTDPKEPRRLQVKLVFQAYFASRPEAAPSEGKS